MIKPKPMRAIEARQIPILDYLEREGIKPAHVRQGGNVLWYSSPLRAGDSDPSFKVDTQKNLWFDHGIDRGGNVLDLVCELRNITVRDALRLLEEKELYRGVYLPGSNPALFPGKNERQLASEKEKRNEGTAKNSGAFEVLKVGEVRHPALIEYLQSREINLEIARQYLKEVHFKPVGQAKQFFALGWPCGRGYDVRNKLFKGFVGTGKTISTVNLQEGNGIYIFEGWMDFLSFLAHHDSTDYKGTSLILHSTALRKRAIELIKTNKTKRITLFLDNDDAGRDTAEFFKSELPDLKVFDRAIQYGDRKSVV